MAYEEAITFTRRTGICGATSLEAKQYHAVTLDSTGLVLAGAGVAMDGILQDNPAVGKAGAFAVRGVSKAAIAASQTLTGGTTLLEVDSAGCLIATIGGTVVAKALESVASSAGITIIAVELLPSNAAFA